MYPKYYMEYTYTKKLFSIYLKFKGNGASVVLLAKSGNPVQGSQ